MSRPIAMVTGASAGIGRAFAEQLAARGHDLVVVARDTGRLEALAKELDALHGTSVEVLTADLSGGEGIARAEVRVIDEARPVALLVNNAGFGTVGRFHELPVSREVTEIGLNVVAVARLTHAALPGMVAMAAAFAGMFLGQAVRSRLEPEAFRRWFLIAMLLLGIYLAGTALYKVLT